MASPKRNKQQILLDRIVISDLYMRGWPQGRIAEYLSNRSSDLAPSIQYSEDMIKRDLKAVRDGWLESSLRNFDEMRAEQLAKLDAQEAEAWREWKRSCEDYKKKAVGTSAQGKIDKTETGTQTGDPRYLTAILSIVERRCRLLGLDLPQKVAPTTPDGKDPYKPLSLKGVPDEELSSRIQELLGKIPGKPGGGC